MDMHLRVSFLGQSDPGSWESSRFEVLLMKEIVIGFWFGMAVLAVFFIAIGEMFLAGAATGAFVCAMGLFFVVLGVDCYAAHRRAMERLRSEERTGQ